MAPNIWLILVLPHVVILLFGFAVLWSALRRLRLTAYALAGVIGLGILAIQVSLRVEGEWGLRCLQVGMVSLFLGVPAIALIVEARAVRSGKRGPLTVSDWTGSLAGYWFFCWVLLVIVYGVASVVNPPPGGFR